MLHLSDSYFTLKLLSQDMKTVLQKHQINNAGKHKMSLYH